MLTASEVEAIARADAQTKYRDLSVYTVDIKQKDGLWQVVFTPKDNADGGGPVYEIDSSGTIVSKKYYQ